MINVVHYHKDTGAIGAWGSADSTESHLPDHLIARLEDTTQIDPRTHRIDVATGGLVEKSASDIAQENAPRLFEIESIVRGALAASDEYMMPDRTVSNLDAWIIYRQALRDLSDRPDAAAMIDAWPVRPDGIDAIAGLRTRLTVARAAQNAEA